MITLLATSSLRSLLLGVIVWSTLKLFRLRDTRAETLIWTLVLAASLAMPFLMRELPVGIALPGWQGATPLPASMTAAPLAQPGWFALHGATLLWSLYAGVALVGLLRLFAGLLLCLKLYRDAKPVEASWARGNVRASAAIDAPLSFGTAILVPADCHDWPMAKQLAVLAHEEAHVRRGDFFIQFLAGLHRAIFWFNPFAWWLQAHLRDLAETPATMPPSRN
jgi:beta-lactamase regulating signal transducer with metallopeptidase domain